MSDPQPSHLKQKPRRAEPLQPDNPGRGDSTEPSEADPPNVPADKTSKESADRLREQAETAQKNVSEGYD